MTRTPSDSRGTSDETPSDAGRIVDTDRTDRDDATTQSREASDTRRLDRQRLNDQRRQHERGGAQGQASLVRERRDDLQELQQERDLRDSSLAAERRAAGEVLTHVVDERDDAEERVVELTVGDELRDRDLRRALGTTRKELARIEDELAALLLDIPGGPSSRLGEGVERIRAAAARIEQRLDQALDPEDTTSRYHEVGGSG